MSIGGCIGTFYFSNPVLYSHGGNTTFYRELTYPLNHTLPGEYVAYQLTDTGGDGCYIRPEAYNSTAGETTCQAGKASKIFHYMPMMVVVV